MDKSVSIKKKLEGLRATRAEAERTLEQIAVKMDAKRQSLGDDMVAGKKADMNELQDLQTEKARQEIIVEAVGNQIKELEGDLVKAIEAEFEAERDALRDEGKRQLLEIVKTVETLFKMVAQYRGFERRANAKLNDQFGRKGLTAMGVPVDDIMSKTNWWLGRSSMGNRNFMQFLDEAGVMGYAERLKYVDKEFGINAKV